MLPGLSSYKRGSSCLRGIGRGKAASWRPRLWLQNVASGACPFCEQGVISTWQQAS